MRSEHHARTGRLPLFTLSASALREIGEIGAVFELDIVSTEGPR
jgi:hypothetical protein